MKKFLSVVLVLSLCVGLAVTVFAGESGKQSEIAAVGGRFTIATAFDHGYAIRNGTLWAWGDEFAGVDENDYHGIIDKERPVPEAIMDGAVSVRTTGYNATFVLKSDGTLWSWGNQNSGGILGDGRNGNTSYVNSQGYTFYYRVEPMQILDKVSAICAEIDYDFAFAIKEDGSLWGWGANDEYQLGDGTKETRLSPIKILDDVKAVRIENNEDKWGALVYAAKTDGTYWKWGTDDEVVFENNSYQSKIIAEYKTPTLATEDETDIIAGFSDSKIGSDGNYRYMYRGTEKVIADVVEVTDSGYDDYLLLKKDGTLWYRGRNGGSGKESAQDFTQLLFEGESAAAPPPITASSTARPTSSPVLVNGEQKSFDAYNIADNNYFKLRDLAYVLSGTEKQFEVGYDDATKAITLTSGESYTAVGGEMEGKGAENKTANPTSSKIYLDGTEISLTAYNIGGNNYFKLRDIGETFDFEVDWDGENRTIVIDTSKGYTPD